MDPQYAFVDSVTFVPQFKPPEVILAYDVAYLTEWREAVKQDKLQLEQQQALQQLLLQQPQLQQQQQQQLHQLNDMVQQKKAELVN